MAEQTLDVRRQRVDVRGGGFLEGLEGLDGLGDLERLEVLEELERLEALEVLEKLEAQQRAMAKLKRKRNNITQYARAYTHTTGVLYFLLSQVSHKLYNPLCKVHPTFGVMCPSPKKRIT